jgi:hypothetical protein
MMSSREERCSCRRDGRVVLGLVGEARVGSWTMCELERDSEEVLAIWLPMPGMVSGQAGSR